MSIHSRSLSIENADLKKENELLVELSHEAAGGMHEMSIRALKAEEENTLLRAALEAAPFPYQTFGAKRYTAWFDGPRAEALKVKEGL